MLEPGLANPGRWPAALRQRAIVSLLTLGLAVSGATAVFAHDTLDTPAPNAIANAAASSAAYLDVAAVGTAVDVDGTLQILHADNADGTSRYHYFLESKGERLELHFRSGGPTHLLTGASVRIRGLRANHEIAVDSPTADVETLFGPTSAMVSPLSVVPNTLGVQRVAVILVNFSDNVTQPYTPAQVPPLFFTAAGSVSNWDLENSYGQTSLTGDVFGWYVIAQPSIGCQYDILANQAKAAATADGVNLANYNRYVFAFPQTSDCHFSGMGTVGGNPSSSWLNGQLTLGIVAHEMGHNFGLYHSHAWDCGTVPIGTGCTSLEYGDIFDTMGSSPYHFNAFQKERLGWLNYGAAPPMTTVTSSGTYVIDGYETQGHTPKALKIPIGTTANKYYVEYRRPVGFDAAMSVYPNAINGVLIHLGGPTADSSQLLDMTASATWTDAALAVGQSFTDSINQITITPVQLTATNASVAVTFGTAGCTRVNPTVTMSPAQSAAVAGGTMVSFLTSVTNNDTANCGASTFDLTNTVPAGGTWTATFSAPALTISPGQTVSTPLQVTSPASAASGSNPITATARNHGATAYAATASATYVVSAATCTRANPTVALSPATSAAVAAGTPVSFTLSVTNKDSAACASSTFDLTDTVPSGFSATLSSATLSLSPSSVGTATLQVTSPASATNGSKPVTATATNHGATSFKATGSATYVVANPVCTRANPTVTLSPSQSAGVASGTAVSFAVSVTNTDSGACAASTFNLTKSVPAGWTSTVSPTAVSLSPGASGSATLQVTSAAAAVNGNFAVTATATNGSATSFKTTGSATYVVSNTGGGTTGTYSDDFNRPDDTAIGTAWTEVAGNFVISGNMLKNAPQSGNAIAVVSTLSGGTQTAGADFTSVDNNLGPRFGIVLSYQNPTNYYLLSRQTGGSSRLLISKIVNGVETVLGTSSLANPPKGVPFHLTASASGTTLKLDFNGVNKITVNDATFPAGKVGVMVGTGGTFQQQADNFTATVQ